MKCDDRKCAVHGSLKVRGDTFKGIVTSAKARKSATVERELMQFVPKFERYKKVNSKIHAHNPDCIKAVEGDVVRIGETRKMSKTKAFAILEILERGKSRFVREDTLEGREKEEEAEGEKREHKEREGGGEE